MKLKNKLILSLLTGGLLLNSKIPVNSVPFSNTNFVLRENAQSFDTDFEYQAYNTKKIDSSYESSFRWKRTTGDWVYYRSGSSLLLNDLSCFAVFKTNNIQFGFNTKWIGFNYEQMKNNDLRVYYSFIQSNGTNYADVELNYNGIPDGIKGSNYEKYADSVKIINGIIWFNASFIRSELFRFDGEPFLIMSASSDRLSSYDIYTADSIENKDTKELYVGLNQIKDYNDIVSLVKARDYFGQDVEVTLLSQDYKSDVEGDYTFTFKAVDSYSNESTLTLIVHVIDYAPTISIKDNVADIPEFTVKFSSHLSEEDFFDFIKVEEHDGSIGDSKLLKFDKQLDFKLLGKTEYTVSYDSKFGSGIIGYLKFVVNVVNDIPPVFYFADKSIGISKDNPLTEDNFKQIAAMLEGKDISQLLDFKLDGFTYYSKNPGVPSTVIYYYKDKDFNTVSRKLNLLPINNVIEDVQSDVKDQVSSFLKKHFPIYFNDVMMKPGFKFKNFGWYLLYFLGFGWIYMPFMNIKF